MGDWPKYNTRAWLRLPCCGAEHPTRVEDFTGKNDSDCIIAAPQAPHQTPVSTSGLKKGFFIGWVDYDTAVEVPVQLIDNAEEPVPTWTVRMNGKISSTTRRRYVRVDYETEIALHLPGRGAPATTTISDLSEGGVSCMVDEWANDPGSRVFDVEFTVENTPYRLKAQAAWWGRLDERDRRPVGIQFVDVDPKISDQIRSFVFAEQLRQRRASAV